jgi:hypothetical protein
MPGAKRQIFDPDKFMPSSPVSPGTPQQPTRAMPMNAIIGVGVTEQQKQVDTEWADKILGRHPFAESQTEESK